MNIVVNIAKLHINRNFAINFCSARKAKTNFNTKQSDTFEKRYILEKEIQDGVYCKARPFREQKEFSAKNFFRRLKYENAQSKYIKKDTINNQTQEEIKENKEAQQYARQLENLTPKQKKETVEFYCKMTGFPNLAKVRKNIEKEITNAIHKLSGKENFETKFIGYDKNCSIGRTMAIPGSDADGLYIIIDDKGNHPDWFPGIIRWKYKDAVNQRLVQTPAGHLPEVLSQGFIQEGLDLASWAFESNNFSDEELKKFQNNLSDSSNDFTKSAEFDIRLAQKLPCDTQTRDKFYKTAMLTELIREGVTLENNFSDEFMEKIKNSPLYKYSNIMKMQGLSNKPKQKHLNRLKLVESFDKLNPEEQFEIIKYIIYFSLDIRSNTYKNLFENFDTKGQDEMGNILEMYDLLMHSKDEN